MITTTEEIESALRRIKYKPNFSFGVDKDYYAIIIVMRVLDSRNFQLFEQYVAEGGDHPCKIQVRFSIPFPPSGFVSDEYFFQWMRNQCLFVETHECDEWFQVDGKRVNDPHTT